MTGRDPQSGGTPVVAILAVAVAVAVVAGAVLGVLFAASGSVAAVGDAHANHPTPTEESTTDAANGSDATGPPRAASTTAGGRDVLLVIGGLLTGGLLVGLGVLAEGWLE